MISFISEGVSGITQSRMLVWNWKLIFSSDSNQGTTLSSSRIVSVINHPKPKKIQSNKNGSWKNTLPRVLALRFWYKKSFIMRERGASYSRNSIIEYFFIFPKKHRDRGRKDEMKLYSFSKTNTRRWRCPGVGNGNPPQYSYLENSMNRGASWATKYNPCGHKESDTTEQLTHTYRKSGLQGKLILKKRVLCS